MSELHQCPFVSREDWKKKSSSSHASVQLLSRTQNPSPCPSNRTTGWLLGLSGAHVGEDIRITEGEMYVGSGWDSDIVITIPEVSRKHAKITTTKEDTFIQDNASATGVSVNGENIQEAKKLKHGDKIKFGVGEFLYFALNPDADEGYLSARESILKALNKAVAPTVGWLVCRSGEYLGLDFRLSLGLNRVGSLPGIEVALPDQNLNSVHMNLECSMERFYLRPGYANMSVIRAGSPIEHPARLQDGDTFKIGALELVLRSLT